MNIRQRIIQILEKLGFIRPKYQTAYCDYEYYEAVLLDKFIMIWAGTLYGTEPELRNLCYCNLLNAFLEKSEESYADRRAILFKYISNIYNPFDKTGKVDKNRTINKHKRTLPISSIINNILIKLCTIYDNEPTRTFDDDEIKSKIINSILYNLKFDEFMDRNYQRAKVLPCIAVMPYAVNDKLKLMYFTPDKFRAKFSNGELVEFCYPTFNTATKQYEFKVLLPNIIETRNSEWELISSEKNQYKEIPVVILTLNDSGATPFSGGWLELVEEQLKLNKIEFDVMLDESYNACPAKEAVNVDLDDIDISPDSVIKITDKAPPELGGGTAGIRFIEATPQFSEIEDYRILKQQQMYINVGIPQSWISGETATPTGVARMLELIPLYEIRRQDINYITNFENRLLKLMQKVAEMNTNINFPKFDSVSIYYPTEKIRLEPSDEYEFDKTQLRDGIITIKEFYDKWSTSSKNLTEEKIIELIKQNKENAKLLNAPKPEIKTLDTELDEQEEKIDDQINME